MVSMAHFAFAANNDDADITESASPTETDDDSLGATNIEGTKSKSPEVTHADWYGGSILMADLGALSLGALSIGLANGSSSSQSLALPGALVALTTYAAGGPIIHAMHHNYGNLGTSIVLRLTVPVGGALVGAGLGVASAGDCRGDMCGLGQGLSAAIGGVIGFGAGLVLASAIDIGGMAYEETATPERRQVALVPSVDIQKGGAGLNLVGTW